MSKGPGVERLRTLKKQQRPVGWQQRARERTQAMGADRQGAEKALDLLQGTSKRDLLVRFALERSSVREMAHRGSKKSTASITSQLCSVASQ